MSGPAFTPGPWRVSCVRTRLGGEPVLQILAADEKAYALVFYSGKTPEQHRASYADASLIAAAPDLYAALEAAETLHQQGILFSEPSLWESVHAMRRAALTKAKGVPDE